MIAAVWGFVTSPIGKFIAIAAALTLVAAGVTYVLDDTFNKGVTSEKAVITDAVQSDTIKKNENARINKEVINEQISKETPDAVLDRTR